MIRQRLCRRHLELVTFQFRQPARRSRLSVSTAAHRCQLKPDIAAELRNIDPPAILHVGAVDREAGIAETQDFLLSPGTKDRCENRTDPLSRLIRLRSG